MLVQQCMIKNAVIVASSSWFFSDRSCVQAVPIRTPVQMHDSGSLSPLGGLAYCFAANPICRKNSNLVLFSGLSVCVFFFFNVAMAATVPELRANEEMNVF